MHDMDEVAREYVSLYQDKSVDSVMLCHQYLFVVYLENGNVWHEIFSAQDPIVSLAHMLRQALIRTNLPVDHIEYTIKSLH